jgi:hypothetical protein
MQLCFSIASVHKQYLNSALVDRYFLDKFNQTSVFLNHTFILSTLRGIHSRARGRFSNFMFYFP